MGKGHDLKDMHGLIYGTLSYVGTLTDGVTAYSSGHFLRTGDEDRVEVEPAKRSGASPSPGPDLDSMTRLVVLSYLNMNGATIDPRNIQLGIDLSRDNSNWVELAPPGGLALTTLNGNFNGQMHVLEAPLPAGMFQDQAEAGDIDDQLIARLAVTPSSSSSGGSLIVAATIILMPGPLTGASTPPRGAAFSVPGIDY